MQQLSGNNAKRILLIATSHVGNNIFCTPAIMLLIKHLPEAHIGVIVTSKRGASVFSENTAIKSIYISPSIRKLRQIAKNYDLAIGLHASSDVTNYCDKITIPCIKLWDVSSSDEKAKHRAENKLRAMQIVLNCPITDTDRHYELGVQQSHLDRAIKLLKKNAHDRTRIVGMHLGCGHTQVHGWKFFYRHRDHDPRLWPLEKYIELAHFLHEARSDIRLVITGTFAEKFMAKKMMKSVPDIVNLIGKTSLQVMAAAIQTMDAYVTQDTGALHVASATTVPMVCLFGPSDPDETGPYPKRDNQIILKESVIADIEPTDVGKEILKLLA